MVVIHFKDMFTSKNRSRYLHRQKFKNWLICISDLGVEQVENLPDRVELTDFRIKSNSKSIMKITNRVEFRVPIFGQFFNDFLRWSFQYAKVLDNMKKIIRTCKYE